MTRVAINGFGNAAFRKAADTSLAEIIGYADGPLVSTDIVGSPYSCVFDSELTSVEGPLVRTLGWYDNEWGYSCRLVELAELIGAAR